MDATITDFRSAKQQYDTLKGKAKKVYQAEFSECLNEAARLYTEFKAEFGEALSLPSTVIKFTANADIKTRKPRTPKTVVTPAAENTAPATTGTNQPADAAAISGRKLAGLKKSYNSLSSKITTAKAAGEPTKELEDSLYQVTDELRLAGINVESLAVEAVPAPVVIASAPSPKLNGGVSPF